MINEQKEVWDPGSKEPLEVPSCLSFPPPWPVLTSSESPGNEDSGRPPLSMRGRREVRADRGPGTGGARDFGR